jgi:Mrp family chromosome partitioning ATPase
MGKGGVGKTTVAASLAALEAETHGEAIFVEFGDGESGRRALAGAQRNVEHVVIRPARPCNAPPRRSSARPPWRSWRSATSR